MRILFKFESKIAAGMMNESAAKELGILHGFTRAVTDYALQINGFTAYFCGVKQVWQRWPRAPPVQSQAAPAPYQPIEST